MDEYSSCCVWRCSCERSDPLIIPLTDLKKVRLPTNLIPACEVCRSEFENARGKTGHLWAWLERNRPLISEEKHLYLPDDLGYCRDVREGRSIRTRRFVYETFWKKNLNYKHFVRSKCCDEHCINPYHLYVCRSPAAKVSQPIRHYIQKLAAQGVSSKTTQLLLRDQLSLDLSVRSIQCVRSVDGKSKKLVIL